MKAVVMGYHTMGCLGFEALLRHGFEVPLVLTHRDEPREEIWWESLAEKALARGIPVYYPESMKDPHVRDLVSGTSPDFIFSFYFRFMIPPAILELAKEGALNLHGSLLPRYRGRAPVNWVLVNGETETGVSLHYMVAKPDAGDLVDQERVAIEFDETPLSLYAKLEAAAVALLDRDLPMLREGRAPRRALDLAQGSYFGGRKPADGLLRWDRPALELYYLTRGVTHPYPGAFTFWKGKKLLVWWARPLEAWGPEPPGTVAAVAPAGFEVAAGRGRLLITRCQLEDGPELGGGKFAEGNGLKIGEQFTNGDSENV